MRAFRAFDPEDKGYIDGEYLKNMLMTRGDSFRPKVGRCRLTPGRPRVDPGLTAYGFTA